MSEPRWRHPREYPGGPVCGIQVACQSQWPDCVTASKEFGIPRAEACEIGCQRYDWFECEACVVALRSELENGEGYRDFDTVEEVTEWLNEEDGEER